MPRILISDALAGPGLDLLQAEAQVTIAPGLNGAELLSAVREHDALVVRSATKVTAEVLGAGGRLRVVGRAGVGVDNIDVDEATRRGIVVVNSAGASTIAVAEHAFALILALARNVAPASAAVARGEWSPGTFLGTELHGKVLGIVGLGRIGTQVARRARAFEMRVLAHDPYVSPALAAAYPPHDAAVTVFRAGRCEEARAAYARELHAALAAKRVLFFSMEMPAQQIAERLISMGSGVPLTKITRGSITATDAERIIAVARGDTGSGHVFVDDTPDQPAARIMALTRRAVRRWGADLVVVDYLQLMRPENPDENRTQQVGLMARRIKQLARECGVPVVCLCQLNRQVENRPGASKPRLADLRESGEIEAHADAVLLLSPQPNQDEQNEVWLIDATVAKNRHGPVGEVTLAYRRPCVRFENYIRGGESDRYAA